MALEEYLLVREARLALLCVGEELSFVHLFQDEANKIKRYNIIEINNDSVVIEYLGYSSFVPINNIEYYEGELYAWNPPQRYNNYSRMGKVEAMIQIIESKYTKHLNAAESLI
jgi:hypothetical protein